jgi:hypothetical protein
VAANNRAVSRSNASSVIGVVDVVEASDVQVGLGPPSV